LPQGQRIEVYDDDKLLGVALDADLTWTFAAPGLNYGPHVIFAAIVRPGPATPIRSGVWSIVVRPDSRLPPTGIRPDQCYAVGSDAFVACSSTEAIALSGAGKQDGMIGGSFAYATVARPGGGSYDKSECVYDAATSLTWEGKTYDVGPRGVGWTYTNLEDNRGSVFSTQSPYICREWPCDAASYVDYVNGIALCGRKNWRLPTAQELHGLLNLANAALVPGETVAKRIDPDWFMATGAWEYWTSSPVVGFADQAWAISFLNSTVRSASRAIHGGVPSVRLVSAASPPIQPRYAVSVDGTEVTDRETILTWRRCSEGQSYDGRGSCMGSATLFTHEQALLHAKDQAGWRLPNVKESASLVHNSTFDAAAFPATPDAFFWTASTGGYYGPSTVWIASSSSAAIEGAYRTETHPVRLVR
jgi:hypothetical protein